VREPTTAWPEHPASAAAAVERRRCGTRVRRAAAAPLPLTVHAECGACLVRTGYITIIVMVILAEATRAAMGLAAFGAEGSDSDFGYDELYDETSYIEPSKAAAPPTLGAKPKPGADKKDDEELNRSKSSSFVGQVQSAVL
jgi:hypothetical protein